MKKYKIESSYISDSLAINEFNKCLPDLEKLHQGKIRMIRIIHPVFGIYPIIEYTLSHKKGEEK